MIIDVKLLLSNENKAVKICTEYSPCQAYISKLTFQYNFDSLV